MKSFLQRVVYTLNTINEWVGRTVSWLTLLLVLLVCFNVMRRHFFNSADAWGGELEWHLFALIFLLGAGYAFKYERHVRVDLFYAKYSERNKAWTNLIGGLLFLIPWCAIVIWFSWNYAMGSWEINETSPNPNGLPYRYIIKFAITVGIGFLLLQALSSVIQSIMTLMDRSKTEISET